MGKFACCASDDDDDGGGGLSIDMMGFLIIVVVVLLLMLLCSPQPRRRRVVAVCPGRYHATGAGAKTLADAVEEINLCDEEIDKFECEIDKHAEFYKDEEYVREETKKSEMKTQDLSVYPSSKKAATIKKKWKFDDVLGDLGSSSLLLSSSEGQGGADISGSDDSIAFEQEVVKLMEINVTSAM
ncbi:hypothetical protein ZIOFF_012042 [Zingiber officinale]|uniref:Uncharacterized protein n=1 Tax=Zingiber officinale TaxID=94328 RepID=A0A8J5HL69_ZINOF|nr:hypothetical protein ZIOFF_012042 [Zingiber officinale]